jgi:hypothetical protein
MTDAIKQPLEPIRSDKGSKTMLNAINGATSRIKALIGLQRSIASKMICKARNESRKCRTFDRPSRARYSIGKYRMLKSLRRYARVEVVVKENPALMIGKKGTI